LKDTFPDFDAVAHLRNPTFRTALINRGIKIPVEPGQRIRDLTDEQVAAIATVLNFEDKRSRSAKLKSLGISPVQWMGWMKEPKFKKFLHQLSRENFQDSVHVAHEGMLRAVDRGDTNAIKFYMELTGRYTQSTPSEQNIRIILARVIESIQRHVQDPDILRAIATDFDAIMRGEVPVEKRQIESTI
jgi:hypothetical protein